MTPGNNGASTPEDDDPFGYLYEDGQARGAQPPSGGGYGYPNSVNRVRAVGDRRPAAGPQQQTAAYGQVPQQYGQPPQPQQYGAPQQQGAYGSPQQGQGLHQGPPQQQPPRSGNRGGGGRGPNTKGLLIGAVAVVLAVVVGIVIAVSLGDKKDKEAGNGTTPTPGASSSASASASDSGSSPKAEDDLPETTDAKAMKLDNGATTASDIKGSKSGTYVTGLNTEGASVTWTVNGIPKTGTYTVFALFNVTGEDQEMTLSVNGKPFGSKVNFGNFTHSTDPTRAWTNTYAWPTLTKGTNTISISCQSGDKCNVLLDQMALRKGQVKTLD
ncbi:carbohydrate-binding protein [Streptomyces acidiscabies]|uniref:Carbohydrate-binding protein n=1 Tax=Streptomyces acidiscabies TaxID=42234 RepID=A0A0L0KFD5_9ACTN|nr:carbohydrate-binding protein [Streptomyces acidiscabies]KND36867.1 carbohydrate-binding protein [Streptomyces acidiscabies]